ncbi:MAG: hypothetical protein ABSD42_02525 [Candidatus Bathyarchaeia archaeon]|jgi:hypothetical protein
MAESIQNVAVESNLQKLLIATSEGVPFQPVLVFPMTAMAMAPVKRKAPDSGKSFIFVYSAIFAV